MDTDVLLKNWEAIKTYCKENYQFTKDFSFEWKHEVYYRIGFGVTKNGEAYFFRGSHGWANDFEFGKPDGVEATSMREVYGAMEEVERDWQIIKSILEKEKKEEYLLRNFVV